mgnify:CR=1 FL=1
MNIAIIPARIGSKRIKEKNIKNFFGKPIICYSILAAQQTGIFSKIIVTTDSLKIAKIAKKYGADIFFRSKKLVMSNIGRALPFKNSDEIFSTKLKNNLDSIIRQKQSKWIRGSVLIDDTYNANPESVKKALDLLATSSKRKIVVLGDMLELGRLRKKMHKDVGKYAATKKIDIFLGFGDLTKYAVEGFGKNGIFFNDEILLREFLKKNIQSKDVVLIKGSRGMKMERYIDV